MTLPFSPLQAGFSVEARKSFKVLCLLGEGSEPEDVRRLLRLDGFVVEVCATPEEGLGAVVDDLAIGTVLCDLQCGAKRAQRFFSNLLDLVPNQRALKAVFLTGDVSIDDLMEAVRLQVVDVLRKPADPRALLEAVRRADRLLQKQAAETLIIQRAIDLSESVAAMTTLSQGGARCKEEREDRTRLGEGMGESVIVGNRTMRDLRRVKVALRAQKAQRKLFGPELVANPCWDMLLDLYEKTLMHKPVSVSSLALASCVPVTTALRRIAKLEELRFVQRAKDHADGRRVFIELTTIGQESLTRYLELIER